MRKALTDLLFPLWEKAEITTTKEKLQLLRKVIKYIEQDREHFIELESPDAPPFLSEPENGIIGKLVPVAQRVTTDEDQFHRENIAETLSVMVANGGAPVLLYSTERAHFDKHDEEWSFRYPTYHVVESDLTMDDLTPGEPTTFRPVASDFTWQVYCMLFHGFARLTPNLHPTYVPHKTEHAMLTLHYAEMEAVTIDETVYYGKLIPMAIAAEPSTQYGENGETTIQQKLYLLVTREEAHYVIKTETTYVPYKDLPGGNDPLDILAQSEPAQISATYQIIALESIDTRMFPLYN